MKEYLKKISLSFYLIAVLAIINLLIAYLYIDLPKEGFKDTRDIVYTMERVRNNVVPVDSQDVMRERVRMLNSPLLIYTSVQFAVIFPSLKMSMLFINLVLYFLIIPVFYLLSEEIFKNRKISIISTILFFTNFCMFTWGTAYLADMGGWFFYVLSSLFALKYLKLKDNKFFYLSILTASAGMLFKEYAALGMVNLAFLILISDMDLRQKIKKIALAAFLFSLIPLAWHAFIYFKYDWLYLDWFIHNLKRGRAGDDNAYDIVNTAKVLGWLYFFGWPLFLYGVLQAKKYLDKANIKVLLALLPASIAFLAWPGLDTPRVAFIFVPWLSLVAAFGLSRIRYQIIVYILLLIYMICNYNAHILINIINVPI